MVKSAVYAHADVAQPDQARIVGINAQYFLKNNGNFVISIKASCIDSTAPPEAVFAREVRLACHLESMTYALLQRRKHFWAFDGSMSPTVEHRSMTRCRPWHAVADSMRRVQALLPVWSAGKGHVQVKKLQEQVLKPKEQVTLEPYERDHAMVVGVYRPPPKKKQ